MTQPFPSRSLPSCCDRLPPAWYPFFSRALALHDKEAPAGKDTDSLFSFVDQEYAQADAGGIPVYPPRTKLFRAFEFFNPAELRVVLLGQDPYHAPGQAEGLSFSVPDGTKTPPSLKNIFKERESDLGIPAAGASPCLASWAKQGVLLLNTTLTVRDGAAGSHRGHGWERLTDCMLQLLGQEKRPLVFILWGADARKKSRLLTNPAHLILEAEHPSPLSAYRGFFGSRPFSAVNAYLSAHGYDEIDWRT